MHKCRKPPHPHQNRGYSQRSYQNRTSIDNKVNSRDRGQFRQEGG